MTQGSIVLGYHGCDREFGENILAGHTELHSSTNDYDWLGSGIYLWENDSVRALDWAKKVQKHGKMSRSVMSEPFVLGVIVEMDHCLDLLQAQSIALVKEAYHALKQAHDQAGQRLPQNSRHQGELALRRLDCAVIRYLHQFRLEAGLQPFDTIRAAFPEGHQLYPGAGFQERTHIQLCIRQPRNIIGYFRVKGRP